MASAGSRTAMVVVLVLFVVAFESDERFRPSSAFKSRRLAGAFPQRKLLVSQGNGDDGADVPTPFASSQTRQTDRIGDECSTDDIVVHQRQTAPLPNGIPTYTVTILNVCSVSGGCSMEHIHLSCGWFSSYRLVNPRIFRRLRYNDCLLNDGRPFPPGSSISFQYADTYSYPMSVSSASCIASRQSLPPN